MEEGTLAVTVYPAVDALVQMSGGCAVSVSQDCPEYVITHDDGSGPVDGNEYAAIAGSSGEVQFSIENAGAPAGCQSTEISLSYDCVADCPSSSQPVEQQSLCDGDVADLPEAVMIAAISDPNGTAVGAPNPTLFWFWDADLSLPYIGDGIDHAQADICAIELVTLYAAMQCSVNEAYLPVGQLQVSVYPEPELPTIVLEDSVCSYRLDLACPELDQLESIDFELSAEPGTPSGVAVVTLINDGGCWDDFGVEYPACPLACPTFLSAGANSTDLCDGANVELGLVVDDESLGTVQWTLPDGSTVEGYSISPVLSTAANCPEQQSIAYQLLCVQDGSVVEEGSLVVVVFPVVDFLAQGAGTCLISVEQSCPEYQISFDDGSGAVLGTQFQAQEGQSGEVTFSSINPNAPQSCNSAVLTVVYSCPSCIPAPDPVVEDISYCEGENVPSISVEDTGDDFHWYAEASATTLLGTGVSYQPLQSGVYWVQAISPAPEECASMNIVAVTVNEVPLPSSNFYYTSSVFCPEEGIITPQIEGVGVGQFNMTPAAAIDSVSGALDLSLLMPGLHEIHYEVAVQGCSNSSTETIELLPIPDLNLFGPEAVCAGETIVVMAETSVNEADFNWELLGATLLQGDLQGPGPLELLANANQCIVQLEILENGCSSMEELVINVEELSLTISGGGVIQLNETTALTADASSTTAGPLTYNWIPAEGLSCTDCANPMASPSESTDYVLTVEDAIGCLAQEIVSVIVDAEKQLKIPNAFSPNGDGVNDLFRAISKNVERSELQIFDRWGKNLYSSNNLNWAWDGTFKGESVPLGVYVYYIRTYYADGSEGFSHGNVTLVR